MKKKWAKIILSEILDYQKVLHWYEKFGYNVYYYYLKFRSFITQKPIPMFLVYETNTQCTLRCKECHSHMPYFPDDKQYMITFEEFKEEIDKLLKSVDILPNFRFQGGETLLVKDLPRMIEYACSKKQIQHIQVITNGTILPSQELLDSMKNPKVLLFVSDYSCNDELIPRLKLKEIFELCKNNNANCKHWITKKENFWIGRNSISNNNFIDEKQAKKNYFACYGFINPKCVQVFKGKLYICPPAAYFDSVESNFNIPEDEVIDILSTPQKLLSKKIDKLANGSCFKLCSRCNAYENKDVRTKPGVQICN